MDNVKNLTYDMNVYFDITITIPQSAIDAYVSWYTTTTGSAPSAVYMSIIGSGSTGNGKLEKYYNDGTGLVYYPTFTLGCEGINLLSTSQRTFSNLDSFGLYNLLINKVVGSSGYGEIEMYVYDGGQFIFSSQSNFSPSFFTKTFQDLGLPGLTIDRMAFATENGPKFISQEGGGSGTYGIPDLIASNNFKSTFHSTYASLPP
jgi:hypothetical protein